MWLKQNGQNFSGYGKDNENGPTFKIDRGTIQGNEIIFLKRYENDSGPPVQYHGQFSFLTGDNGSVPYMGGDFARETGGNMYFLVIGKQCKSSPRPRPLPRSKRRHSRIGTS